MAEQPLHLQQDPYGEDILLTRFDWRDKLVLEQISKFVRYGLIDSRANVKRQSAAVTARYNKNGKKKRYKSTGHLLRSIAWKTWNESGGDVQIFHAHYMYYEKFLELALGKNDPFTQLPPPIPGKKWKPIPVPGKTRKARPAVPTEMRRRAAKFSTYIQRHFAFAGVAMMVYSISTDKQYSDIINRDLFAHGLNGRGGF